MSEKSLFTQNVIAIIWDFDKTLSPHYMQTPLFNAYGIDERAFWAEVAALPSYYARAGVCVQRDTCYLGHLLSYVQHGRMPGLTNAKLRECGGSIVFFPGIPELFDRLGSDLAGDPFQELGLHVEHYVVSTGLKEMIQGSTIAPKLAGIWASEFIETPAAPGFDASSQPESGVISQIAGFLDHTTKTRALFEINKGVNRYEGISVNDRLPEEERRVPFRNMIYIADGPSDIPSFSVVRKEGGLAYAVYDPDSREQFAQAVALQEQGRVDAYGPADYRPGSQTDLWLRLQVRRMAERIFTDRRQAFDRRVVRGPIHIEEG
ncbi:MAG TPA: haloacid dehalogenase-like hydrolase [Candidatus Hydrogenedentes bacterium]|nr:haloacid dehalogenase-like hydrolase [Candidatus Hydrogenedentota bacterium]HPC17700.1 haloacid dehalogenase-like hydrolase [Candidatus Hydrogenedentota bacterium]HRT21080.1 haloacid dehalogenase-like hydrolase [Candidatus Hydrogenedentota bacterium]HRT66047.1 haloacid dehalogenase-like hydrolase [Candidatus Hydrogenedentota bacterium]